MNERGLLTQTITLKVIYSDGYPPPSEWPWRELLDMGQREAIIVKNSNEPREYLPIEGKE